MSSFKAGNIYLAKADNGEKFVYRCVRIDENSAEFVDLMNNWRHVVFSGEQMDDYFHVWQHSALGHIIDDAKCIGEHVDVESYGDLDAPNRQYELELKKQLAE